ncbi:hypothetical protein HDU93_005182 [Gonapodya sp. JEL0774]|nr:hypothetical protein HDU93_005182 [Gonapodya sp. JEL0774]
MAPSIHPIPSFSFVCKNLEDFEIAYTKGYSDSIIRNAARTFLSEWVRRYAIGGNQWVRSADRGNDWETTYEIMSLICPFGDVRRRYQIKETTLADLIYTGIFNGDKRKANPLQEWKTPGSWHDGDLSRIVSLYWAAERPHGASIKTNKRVNTLLDLLATHSSFSNLFGDGTIAPKAMETRTQIIRALYEDLGPMEAKWLTRIILKEAHFPFATSVDWWMLRLLEPKFLHAVYQTRFDLKSSCAIVDLMRVEGDRLLPAAFAKESLLPTPLFLEFRARWFPPQVGNPVKPGEFFASSLHSVTLVRPTFSFPPIAEARRGHSVVRAVAELCAVKLHPRVAEAYGGLGLDRPENAARAIAIERSVMHGVDEIVAELKYDGERCQIHVDLEATDPVKTLQIWSKSGRNSTFDRFRSHHIILAGIGISPKTLATLAVDEKIARKASELVKRAQRPSVLLSRKAAELGLVERLGLARSSGGKDGALRNVVFDGELLGYNDRTNTIETMTTVLRDHADFKYHPDIMSGNRHYYLIIFDVLVLNSFPVLSLPYTARRALLECLVHPITNYIHIAEKRNFPLPKNVLDPLQDRNVQAVSRHIEQYFAEVIARKQEGIVLKPSNGAYEPGTVGAWYKLKTNYVAGLGDTIDLCVIGCGWLSSRDLKDKNRAARAFGNAGSSSERQHAIKDFPERMFIGALLNKKNVCTKVRHV